MSAITSSDNPSAIVEPPEVKLTAPQSFSGQPEWLVVAKNRRVNREWEALMTRSLNNCQRCYKALCNAPMTRHPGRIFPLRGKRYKGAWEYEVTSGDRVFYIPDEAQRKVVVYYAGEHIKPAPTPP